MGVLFEAAMTTLTHTLDLVRFFACSLSFTMPLAVAAIDEIWGLRPGMLPGRRPLAACMPDRPARGSLCHARDWAVSRGPRHGAIVAAATAWISLVQPSTPNARSCR